MTTARTDLAASAGKQTLNDANRLGLDYRTEASAFAYAGPIIDIHTHIGSAASARLYRDVAGLYGITHTVSMTPIEQLDEVIDAYAEDNTGPTIEFICVPSYARRTEPDTFTTGWLRNIEDFRARGSRIIKFWAAPRGLDFASTIPGTAGNGDVFRLDSDIRRQGMKLAYDLGYRIFMTHVGDPDTWFATTYADAAKYGRKPDHYKPLEALLDEYHDVTWIGAHLSGYPEDLDYVQGLLDRHPNYVVDTSATKWMVRELSRQPQRFAEFCQANPGRVLFGSDIVTGDDNHARQAEDDEHKPDGLDLYASRYWALRTLLETDYAGPSPIVDPDLSMIDPNVDQKATAELRGCSLPPNLLRSIYHDAAAAVLGR